MWANDPEMAKKWEKEEKMKKETKVRQLIKKMVREVMAEDFAGAHPKGKRDSFNKMREKQSEVLGYKLMGTPDIKVEIDDATIKEGFNKRHFLNLIEKEIESLKGQIIYAKKCLSGAYGGVEKWEAKEYKAILKDKIKDLKDTEKHYKRVQKLKEGKTLWELTEEYVNERKWTFKGKYLNMPTGEESSIPGPYDNDALKVRVGRESFNIYKGRKGIIAIGDKYSKEFRNARDLIKWLNKSRAKYVGIDRR